MRGFLYLLFLSCMAAGIIIARYCPLVVVPALALSLVFFLIFIAARKKGELRLAAFPIAFAVLGMVLTSLCMASVRHGALPDLASRKAAATVNGTVSSPPVARGEGTSFFMSVSEISSSGGTWETREKVAVDLDNAVDVERSVFPGAGIRVTGRLLPREKGDDWLLNHGAGCRIRASFKGLGIGRRPADPVSRAIHRMRSWVSMSYRRVFSPRVTGFLEGVTLSKTSDADPEVLSDLRGCGLSHVVAVSGLHVGSAAVLALAMLSMLGAGRKSRYVGACAMAVFVLGLAYFRPSATRAAIMGLLCFSGAVLGRDYDSLAGLSIAGFLILSLNPRALFDQGFQLSFTAALGIVLAVRNRRKLGRFRLALTVCAGAQLGIIPLVVARGEGVPVTALAANFMAVPLVGPLLFSSWSTSLVSIFSVRLARLLALIPAAMARFILAIAFAFSRVPTAGIAAGIVGMVALVIYVAGLLALARRAGKGRNIFVPLVSVLAAALLVMVPCIPVLPATSESITVLDVGQGDAILIRDRAGGAVLVDGGPDERKIIEKLKSLRVNKLDLVVLSHPHADHAAGLSAVLREMPVGRLLYGGLPPSGNGAYSQLLNTASDKHVPRTVAREGQDIVVSSGIDLEVLYAPRDRNPDPENLNNASVVVMARLEDTRVLLTGDIEAEAQKSLIESRPDISCDVLKVPHQGARNAATRELMDSCRPKLAVISVEKDNRYGHPSSLCLKLLKDRRVSTLRTDKNGDIRISTRNGKMAVVTGKGSLE